MSQADIDALNARVAANGGSLVTDVNTALAPYFKCTNTIASMTPPGTLQKLCGQFTGLNGYVQFDVVVLAKFGDFWDNSHELTVPVFTSIATQPDATFAYLIND